MIVGQLKWFVLTRSADSADGIAPRAADVGQAQDSALELDVGEQVSQAVVLVVVLSTENLIQIQFAKLIHLKD